MVRVLSIRHVLCLTPAMVYSTVDVLSIRHVFIVLSIRVLISAAVLGRQKRGLRSEGHDDHRGVVRRAAWKNKGNAECKIS